MKKMIYKTFKFKLKPTGAQRNAFVNYAGSARFVFNWGLELVKKALDAGYSIPRYTDIAKRLTLKKVQEETCWLTIIHSQVLQQSLKDLFESIEAFFKEKNRGFPKFKKKGRRTTFRYPQSIRCEDGRVYLPKIGWVRYCDSRPIEGRIKQATVKRVGVHWYVCLVCIVELEIPHVQITEDTVLGIDVGIRKYIATSDGRVLDNPSYLNKMLEKIRYLSRSLSRKKKFSKNWLKIKNRLQRLHTYISHIRKDFLHKLSTMLTKSQGVLAICVENLNVKGMVQNRRLSRAILDAGWNIFYEFLAYKCAWLGKRLVKIDQYYPSSQICSSCNHREDMPLNVRIFNCTVCGLKLDRDINASINIRSAGTSELLACGEIRKGGLKEAGICGF
jgi:putative transposase